MKRETFLLPANGWVPNNDRVLVVIYRQAVDAPGGEEAAAAFERLFAATGWPVQWRDGVFPYHHYHSTAHEALGIAGGSARLMLGAPNGHLVDVATGDALMLPAGAGHCRISASDDFLVVGAYPLGQDFDLCRDAPTPEMLRAIVALGAPSSEPVPAAG